TRSLPGASPTSALPCAGVADSHARAVGVAAAFRLADLVDVVADGSGSGGRSAGAHVVVCALADLLRGHHATVGAQAGEGRARILVAGTIARAAADLHALPSSGMTKLSAGAIGVRRTGGRVVAAAGRNHPADQGRSHNCQKQPSQVH